MKSGKISEIQCKRSVLKWLPPSGERVIQGAGIGCDYGIMKLAENSQMVTAMATSSLPIREAEKYAFYKAVNKVELSGGQAQAIMVNAMLPARGTEARIREMTRRLAERCVQNEIEYLGGHTELLEALRSPVITVTAYGSKKKLPGRSPKHIEPGEEILMLGFAATEATVILSENRQEELETRYASDYLEGARQMEKFLSLRPALAALGKESITYVHDSSTGGIFAALWELGEAGGCGIEADLRAIPIKQETVEVCEFFDLNPYMALSGGSALLITKNEETLEHLQRAGIFAARIGHTTAGRDRVVRLGEDIRYLTPPKGDEIYKIYNN